MRNIVINRKYSFKKFASGTADVNGPILNILTYPTQNTNIFMPKEAVSGVCVCDIGR